MKETKTETESLVQRMATPGARIITVHIPFTNDDVPRYLEKLQRFVQASKNTTLMIDG